MNTFVKLCGQKNNDSKCEAWGTALDARKLIAEAFPKATMSTSPLSLGAKIPTTARPDFMQFVTRIDAATQLIASIQRLPLPIDFKQNMIAAGPMMKVAWGTEVQPIPKTRTPPLRTVVLKI